MKFGSITTGIVSDGLIFNMDAANRASYVPNSTSSGSIPWGYSPNPSYNPDYTSPSSIPWNY